MMLNKEIVEHPKYNIHITCIYRMSWQELPSQVNPYWTAQFLCTFVQNKNGSASIKN